MTGSYIFIIPEKKCRVKLNNFNSHSSEEVEAYILHESKGFSLLSLLHPRKEIEYITGVKASAFYSSRIRPAGLVQNKPLKR